MRTSKYLLATEKETPNDAELVSHKLMLRAGLIRKLASGIYTWLPTGIRVLRKVEKIIREEMDKTGAMEALMPNLTPAELWQETGRWDKYGPELLRITDRHEREFCFGPTHEESITAMARNELKSYKQLPMTVYQIQTKFRDEIRPRYGVMRGREFLMKDAYSFHIDKESLQATYQDMHKAYSNIFNRLGLKFRSVIADPGSIGGNVTHEFHVLADAGEDDLFYSNKSDYAANVERAESLAPNKNPQATEEIEQFATPNAKTIKDLTEQFNIPSAQSVKTLVIKDAGNNYFALILRGDHKLNEIKANALPQIKLPFEFATDAEIRKVFNASPGSLGPVNCPIPVIADRDAECLEAFCCGANIEGQHLKGANFVRDVKNYEIADLRNVVTGDKSPDGKGELLHIKGIEVGHIFQLEDHYSSKMCANVLNENGKSVTMQMGCYGLGVTRTIAAAIEQNHDENGIIWPKEMAPFDIAIIPMKYCKSADVRSAADKIYADLTNAGFEVLMDDRKESPGAMFAQMDLLGIPQQIIIGERGLKNNVVEHKDRKTGVKQEIALQNIIETLK